jgi:hypothetical protein
MFVHAQPTTKSPYTKDDEKKFKESIPNMNFTSSIIHEQTTSVVSPDALNQPQNP